VGEFSKSDKSVKSPAYGSPFTDQYVL
jgi:hypothetical protein